MRDVVALVNHPDLAGGVDVHMEVCYSCKEGGDLVCCDGCTAAFHLGCANLEAVPEVRGRQGTYSVGCGELLTHQFVAATACCAEQCCHGGRSA